MPTTPSPLTADQVIALLHLTPHPSEGGYFRETFRDTTNTLPTGRPASTLIYFLLRSADFSRLHRLDASETWHFYAGQALHIVELSETGPVVTRLGGDLVRGERPQYVVGGGRWFGSRLVEGDGCGWALVGCTVAPGFEFEKFEIRGREELVREFPECREWIEKLTPEGDDGTL